MATFLELCQAVALESGTGDGTKPVTVDAQTGRMLQITRWVSDAWVDIQNSRNAWGFMQVNFEANLTAGEGVYSADDLGIEDFAGWLNGFTLHADGNKAGEGPLAMISHDQWKQRFDIGEQVAQKPVYIAISPRHELCVGPIPDNAATYVLRGQYTATPQVLEEDEDEPRMPARYHKVIMWKALASLAEHDESAFHLATYRAKYKDLLFAMERDHVRGMISIGANALA
jgi:hypothetical protein